MKVAITEIFCEVITGFALLFVLVGFLDWWGISSFEAGWDIVKEELDGVTLIALVVAAYLLGVIIDSAGLLFDEYCGHLVATNTPSEEDVKNFWKTADAHVLAYRDGVWAYYFCYRNLFMLSVPAAISWGFALCNRGAYGWLIATILLIGGLGFVMFVSMRVLLRLYYTITKSFS